MTASDHEPRDWGEKLGAWLGARWRWLVAGVVLLFALNNLIGIIVGAVGLLLFANRIAGELLAAQRVVQQVQRVVGDYDDHGDGA
jgi:hypothetical protein